MDISNGREGTQKEVLSVRPKQLFSAIQPSNCGDDAIETKK